MLESIVSAVVAVISGGAILTSRIHGRILEIDKRVDQIELSMAQSYITKVDFEKTLERVEAQMIRIENKLDVLANTTIKTQ